MQNLILASSSSYRKSLLERLRISFTCVSPDLDERAHKNESAQAQAVRLASEKAQAVADFEVKASCLCRKLDDCCD